MTSSSSRTTRNLLVPTLWILKFVLASSLSCVSPRNHDISGFGELTSWHSNINLLPSSSWRSCGFCVKLGAKSSATPIFLGCRGLYIQLLLRLNFRDNGQFFYYHWLNLSASSLCCSLPHLVPSCGTIKLSSPSIRQRRSRHRHFADDSEHENPLSQRFLRLLKYNNYLSSRDILRCRQKIVKKYRVQFFVCQHLLWGFTILTISKWPVFSDGQVLIILSPSNTDHCPPAIGDSRMIRT